jgi:hypothetical protein
MVSQETLLAAAQLQPVPAVTLKLPLPPLDAIEALAGEIA